MYEIKNFMNFFNKKIINQFNDFHLLHKSYCFLIHLTLIAICLGFAFGFLSKDINAATVYGHIHCSKDMECPQKITLSIYKDNKLIKKVRTDNRKDYMVFLDPGEYKVKIDLKGEPWEANIRSSSNPIRQDIYPHRNIKVDMGTGNGNAH